MARTGETEQRYSLQVLLPHGAAAGQEVEFPLPVDSTSQLSGLDAPSASEAVASGAGAGDSGAAFPDGGAQRFLAAAAGEAGGGEEATAPPVKWPRGAAARRRDLEEEKARIQAKIQPELAEALEAAEAKDLAPNPVLRPEPKDLVAELEAAQLSGDDDALRAVMEKLNAGVKSY